VVSFPASYCTFPLSPFFPVNFDLNFADVAAVKVIVMAEPDYL
jgi:hypothetical protein